RHQEAVRIFEEALELRRALSDSKGVTLPQSGLVAAWALAGQLDKADAASRRLETLGEQTLPAKLYAAQLPVARREKVPAALLEAARASQEPEVRVALRMLEGAQAKLNPSAAKKVTMEVGPECRWFKAPDAER